MTVNADRFRDVMAGFATGVTVVTGVDGEGGPVGFTANAVCSVSLEPPLMLFCADQGSQSLTALMETGRFAVSVLGAEDGPIARRFSDGARANRFRALDFRAADYGEPPVLSRALAWMRCRVWRSVDAGDHTIVVGEVLDCGAKEGVAPLVFFGGRFRTVGDLPEAPGG